MWMFVITGWRQEWPQNVCTNCPSWNYIDLLSPIFQCLSCHSTYSVKALQENPSVVWSTFVLHAWYHPVSNQQCQSTEGKVSSVSSPSRSGRSPAAKRYLVHFGLKNTSAKSNFKYIFTKIHQQIDKFFLVKTPQKFFFVIPKYATVNAQ